MAREPNIPLFLWVATAALAHILWGGGADQVAEVLEGRATLSRFAQAIRGHVRGQNAPVEISLWHDSTLDEATSAKSREGESDQESPPEDPPPDEEPPAQEPNKSKDAKSESPPEGPQDKEVKPFVKKEKALEPEKPVPVLPIPAAPIELDRRVAVKQSVEDKSQENPTAEFIGEHANRVEEQTQARITSTDQHEPDPTMGENHTGPSDEQGSATVTEIGQSRDSPGDPEEAPSESERDGADKSEVAQAPSRLDAEHRVFSEAAAAARQTQAPPQAETSRGQQARAEIAELEAAPNVVNTPDGPFAVGPEQEARAAQRARKAIAQQAPQNRAGHSPFTGLGTLRSTPGGLNPNLNQLSAQSVIGQEQLQRERVADGERRRSKHRGSFRAVGLSRWRSSIENYVATVKPGNQTALNTARSPFANYLNHIHNRLHPEFAQDFLSSLDSLPRDHAMNRPDIKTHMEIVLNGEDGRVVKLGITRASGSTAFDVGALESVQGASPFGAPPREIVSPDGRVYLHWEFYRDPTYACSTYFAKPYILRVAPSPAPAPAPPTRNVPEEHGKRDDSSPPSQQQDG